MWERVFFWRKLLSGQLSGCLYLILKTNFVRKKALRDDASRKAWKPRQISLEISFIKEFKIGTSIPCIGLSINNEKKEISEVKHRKTNRVKHMYLFLVSFQTILYITNKTLYTLRTQTPFQTSATQLSIVSGTVSIFFRTLFYRKNVLTVLY